MREMLEPVFGSGAIVAQFVITLIVILLLIGFVYWLVRRFSGIRFNGNGRGRGPRLGVIDAVPVDSRRKLVLVRRDNVEHLLLIGGPSDVLVESTIVRTAPGRARPGGPPQAQIPQPAPQQIPQRAAAPAPMPLPAPQPQAQTGISEPIPFPSAQGAGARPARRAVEPAADADIEIARTEPVPQRRAAVRPLPMATEPLVALAAGGGRPIAASAHFEEPTRPTRIESVMALGAGLDAMESEPAEARTPVVDPSPAPEPAAAADQTVEVEDISGEPVDLSPEPAPAIAPDDSVAGPDNEPGDAESAAKVSDLEREMARLLGEITSRRDS